MGLKLSIDIAFIDNLVIQGRLSKLRKGLELRMNLAEQTPILAKHAQFVMHVLLEKQGLLDGENAPKFPRVDESLFLDSSSETVPKNPQESTLEMNDIQKVPGGVRPSSVLLSKFKFASSKKGSYNEALDALLAYFGEDHQILERGYAREIIQRLFEVVEVRSGVDEAKRVECTAKLLKSHPEIVYEVVFELGFGERVSEMETVMRVSHLAAALRKVYLSDFIKTQSLIAAPSPKFSLKITDSSADIKPSSKPSEKQARPESKVLDAPSATFLKSTYLFMINMREAISRLPLKPRSSSELFCSTSALLSTVLKLLSNEPNLYDLSEELVDTVALFTSLDSASLVLKLELLLTILGRLSPETLALFPVLKDKLARCLESTVSEARASLDPRCQAGAHALLQRASRYSVFEHVRDY